MGKSKHTIDFIKITRPLPDEFWGMSEVEHIAIHEAALKRSYVIDSYIQAHIAPKPRLLPEFLWKMLLRKVLVIKHFYE